MNNDIATKSRLNAALGTEGTMGFEHNDIVTVDVMNKAIEEGGGGGGDFSTAQATIVNNVETNFTLTLPNIYDGKLYTRIDSEDIGSELTVTIPLYMGVLSKPMAFNSETAGAFKVSLTGNYENSVIKGDCTITISNY